MRLSSWATCFSLSRICWPSAIRLNSDWFRDFSSISACASDAVRSAINWPCGWRFWSVGLAGEGLAAGEREGAGTGVEALPDGVMAGLGLGDGEGEAPGVSARTPAGATNRPSTPARLSRRTATLRPRLGTATTEGREFTVLQKSLQLLRRGPVLSALSNPKLCLRGPLPARFVFETRAVPLLGARRYCAPFSHFCHAFPASTFPGGPPGHLRQPNLCYHPEKPTRAITGEVIWHRAGF